MAKEYIDRETTIDAITADGFEHFSGCLSSSEVTLLELIRDSVSEIPTVDVVEVVHGEWIVQNNAYTRFKCSACGSENHEYRWEYCCKCGAKMDVGRKDEM